MKPLTNKQIKSTKTYNNLDKYKKSLFLEVVKRVDKNKIK